MHNDWNSLNNYYRNLKWVTRKEMLKRRSEHIKEKIRKSGVRPVPRNTRLKEKDIAMLKSMLLKGVSQSKIAKMFCISEMQVTRIKRGENWGYVKPDMAESDE
jgi:DNA invertase Pin-like site-specific DNA recombinase